MSIPASLQAVALSIQEVVFVPAVWPCPQCQEEMPPVWTIERIALDLGLDGPVLLRVRVSVHHCAACGCYRRAQPPFLRPNAVYTNRVVRTAVASVFEDGMARTRVPARMARDFWLRPSEAMIRHWCRDYAKERA